MWREKKEAPDTPNLPPTLTGSAPGAPSPLGCGCQCHRPGPCVRVPPTPCLGKSAPLGGHVPTLHGPCSSPGGGSPAPRNVLPAEGRLGPPPHPPGLAASSFRRPGSRLPTHLPRPPGGGGTSAPGAQGFSLPSAPFGPSRSWASKQDGAGAPEGAASQAEEGEPQPQPQPAHRLSEPPPGGAGAWRPQGPGLGAPFWKVFRREKWGILSG